MGDCTGFSIIGDLISLMEFGGAVFGKQHGIHLCIFIINTFLINKIFSLF